MRDRDTGERIPLNQWMAKYHSQYTECKAHDCHRLFSHLAVVDKTYEGFSKELCTGCICEIQSYLVRAGHEKEGLKSRVQRGTLSSEDFQELVDEEFEMAHTVIRRKRLNREDVPDWVWKGIEGRLSAAEQAAVQYGNGV